MPLKKFISSILFSLFFLANNSFAEIALIRDAETEKFLRDLTTPIFKAAGLNAKNIQIYIVNDDSINAFVSGGQNVFINTGLIRKYKTPDALIGVIAHETGHITGGHLARSAEGAAEAERAMLLSYLLGIGAAIGGSPDAGSALIMGGSQTAERLYMRFTRTQEEAADQYAIEYLDKLQYPATGLINLLDSFDREMIGYKGQIDEYLMSHPISRKRIDLIKARTQGRNFSDVKINQKLQPQMNWVLAKLDGFMDNPDNILQKDAKTELQLYTKSIALFRKSKTSEALKILDKIINNHKQNGFLYEVKGQFLFESGKIGDAILAYDKAVKLLNSEDSAQSKIAFATAILALKKTDKDLVNLAIKNLEEAKKVEEENPMLLRELSIAYDKINDEGRSFLALAEYNLAINEKDKAREYAKKAKEKLDKNNKLDLIRADDLLELAKEKKEKKS